MPFQSAFTDEFPKHLPVIPFNPISPVKSMGHILESTQIGVGVLSEHLQLS